MTTSAPADGEPVADGDSPEALPPAAYRVAALTGVASALALTVTWVWLVGLPPLMEVPGVGLWTLFAAFAVAEALPAHFEHRREAVSITLTTVPLVVGLFAVSPVTLIAARVLGSALILIVVRHQRPLKLTTNLASFWVQTIVSVLVFRAFSPDSPGPGSWPELLVAVVAGDAAQTVVLLAAISLYQRRWEHSLGDSAVVSTVAALVETSVGIVALTLLVSEPAALVPLTVMTALVLLSLRTHRSLGARHRELAELYEFTSAMGGAQLDGQVVTTLLGQARDLMRAERAWLYLDDGEGGLLSTSTTSLGGPLGAAGREAAAIHRAAHKAGSPILVTPVDVHAQRLLDAAEATELLHRAPRGLVRCDRHAGPRRPERRRAGLRSRRRPPVRDAGQPCQRLARERPARRPAREKARESEHQSLHDSLTGLPNRVLFARHLSEALESGLDSGLSAAVLLLDLDRFKEVNDTLGHHNGDLLLQQVGDRLRGTLRRGDVIARLGGDEFAVLLPDIHGEQAALQVGRGIVELLEQPFVIGDMSVDVGASIGIAVAPRDGDDPVTLVQRADVAMYTAKSDQTGVELYRPDRDGYSPERLMLVNELRQAVVDHQLDVHYQPQVNLADGAVIGVEALVRWNHPTRGLVGPDEFIPVAEHTGLIRPLTRFVLDEALAAARGWREAGNAIRVSVNLSAAEPDAADAHRGHRRPPEAPRGAGRRPVPRGDRELDHGRSPSHRRHARSAPRPRCHHRHRRLRDGPLVARLHQAAPGRRDQGRQVVRPVDAHRSQ